MVVQKYEEDVLASDSENVERLRKAKNAAEKNWNESSQRPGASRKLISISLCLLVFLFFIF